MLMRADHMFWVLYSLALHRNTNQVLERNKKGREERESGREKEGDGEVKEGIRILKKKKDGSSTGQGPYCFQLCGCYAVWMTTPDRVRATYEGHPISFWIYVWLSRLVQFLKVTPLSMHTFGHPCKSCDHGTRSCCLRNVRNQALKKGLSIFDALKLLPFQQLLHLREQKEVKRG